MNKGKINLWKVEIFYKKDKVKLTELEVVGADENCFQQEFYQKRAMGNAGYDLNTDKWDISKFDFRATLIKNLDNEVTIK